MKATKPMYAIERTTTKAVSLPNERQSSCPARARTAARVGAKRISRRSSSSTMPASSDDRDRRPPACRACPHAAIAAVAKAGPMAKPTLPPAANQRIPLAFFSPAT